MFDELTFLSERQNIFLIDNLLSAKRYKEINALMKTINYKEPPDIRPIRYSNKRDYGDFYTDSLSKKASFIFNTNYIHNCDMYFFKIPDDGFAVFHIYQSGGPNDEPISIIHYFHPVKVLLNFPHMRLYKEISKNIDVKSHKVFKDHFFRYCKKSIFDEYTDSIALITIESEHLNYFNECYCVPSYKRNVVYRSIANDWENVIKPKLEEFDLGDVTIRFRISSEGDILWANVLSNTSNESLASISLAIVNSSITPPIPHDVMEIIDHPYLDFEYTFSIELARYWGSDRIAGKRPRVIM
jgi:hypothetical protein